MKPSAALAVGLWVGALAGFAVGALYFRYGPTGGTLPAVLETPAEELRRLKQENARLAAEAQRLKETVAGLQQELAAESPPAPLESLPPSPRRIPFRRTAEPPGGETAAPSVAAESLRRLEQQALENQEEALNELATLASADGAAALMRVWKSGRLTLTNQIRAARLLGAVIELNRTAGEWLEALAATDTRPDARLVTAAAQGIANPAPLADSESFRMRIDYEGRLRCLDWLSEQINDPQLDEALNRAREELLAHWAEAEPTPPQPSR